MRVIEDYLGSFIQKNPDTAAILTPILNGFLGEFKQREKYGFADMQGFMQQQKQAIKLVVPKAERRALFEGGKPVSAKIAEIMEKLQQAMHQEFSSSLPADVKSEVSVKELTAKFQGSKTTERPVIFEQQSPSNTDHRRTPSGEG